MEYLKQYIDELIWLMLDMSPWLLIGFIIAGILHVFFPEGQINRLLGAVNTRSIVRAALIGIPLPLCSCGVIPTGVSIYKNGASKGAAISFLISTPQTGVDSIMITYSLLGLPFALIRPVVALFTGVLGGIFSNKVEKKSNVNVKSEASKSEKPTVIKNPIASIFKYAFVDFLQDIAKWLIIGLLLAALIAVLVPDDFFAQHIPNEFLGMLVILVASVPLYICATSSVPIAAVLLLKGISPGAALVFLMAGPATNAATISVIGNSMGRKTLFTYLVTIITGALAFGLIIDQFFPREWFLSAITHEHVQHEHGLLPRWLQIISAIIMTIALLNIYLKKFFKKRKTKKINYSTVQFNPDIKMDKIKVIVKGMNCSHCKTNVENSLSNLNGIDNINADIDTETVTLSGDNVNLDKVKEVVEGIGYKFEGRI